MAWPRVAIEKRSNAKESRVIFTNPAAQMSLVFLLYALTSPTIVSGLTAKRSWAIFWKNSPNVVVRDETTTQRMATTTSPPPDGEEEEDESVVQLVMVVEGR